MGAKKAQEAAEALVTAYAEAQAKAKEVYDEYNTAYGQAETTAHAVAEAEAQATSYIEACDEIEVQMQQADSDICSFLGENDLNLDLDSDTYSQVIETIKK